MSNRPQAHPRFVVCVRNTDHPASLELGNFYEVVPDPDAVAPGQIRVIDESGEDCLYPVGYFASIEIPDRSKRPC